MNSMTKGVQANSLRKGVSHHACRCFANTNNSLRKNLYIYVFHFCGHKQVNSLMKNLRNTLIKYILCVHWQRHRQTINYKYIETQKIPDHRLLILINNIESFLFFDIEMKY